MLKQARGSGLKGSLAKAAERFLRRQVELEESSPFHDAPAARAEHAARMNEAQEVLRPAARPARRSGPPACSGAKCPAAEGTALCYRPERSSHHLFKHWFDKEV